jgi:rhodanese-related sulfurtransferase
LHIPPISSAIVEDNADICRQEVDIIGRLGALFAKTQSTEQLMAKPIKIDKFRRLFVDDDEFAVIDARAPSEFAAGHLLAASNLPLQRLEAVAAALIPQSDTLCVLCDADGGEAAAAAEWLEAAGYSEVAILQGGIEAWRESGGAIFSGVSVPGKAFGEFIEKECLPPVMTAAELHARQQAGERILLIDARTAEEHASYCIPGAVLCPGGDLIYRALPAIEEGTDIVIHCGGRTRSIIGAQTLIDAGCERVYALENGTMGWQFEGLELERGNHNSLPPPDSASLMPIRALAQQMATRWYIDRMRSIPLQAPRTRYLIDVRSREEYEDGHIAGALHVPGGHLLQNIDRYLLVHNATVILIDSDRVRATTVAVWLRRMGWRRVFVFSLDDDKESLEFGPGPLDSPLEDRDLDPQDYQDMEQLLRKNRAYLEWELALIEQIPGDPAAPYCKLD